LKELQKTVDDLDLIFADGRPKRRVVRMVLPNDLEDALVELYGLDYRDHPRPFGQFVVAVLDEGVRVLQRRFRRRETHAHR